MQFIEVELHDQSRNLIKVDEIKLLEERGLFDQVFVHTQYDVWIVAQSFDSLKARLKKMGHDIDELPGQQGKLL